MFYRKKVIQSIVNVRTEENAFVLRWPDFFYFNMNETLILLDKTHFCGFLNSDIINFVLNCSDLFTRHSAIKINSLLVDV